MVSFNVFRSTASGAYVEGVCLATDEKPVTGIANGSILYAVDASSGETTRYMYDQNSMSWIEAACPCGSGGSGGGSGADIVVCPLDVTFDSEGQPILTARMTAGELYAADGIHFVSELPGGYGGYKVSCIQASYIPAMDGRPETYLFDFFDQGQRDTLSANSANDYPTNRTSGGGPA